MLEIDERISLMQIAASLIMDSPNFIGMTIDARYEEFIRMYDRLIGLSSGKKVKEKQVVQ